MDTNGWTGPGTYTLCITYDNSILMTYIFAASIHVESAENMAAWLGRYNSFVAGHTIPSKFSAKRIQ